MIIDHAICLKSITNHSISVWKWKICRMRPLRRAPCTMRPACPMPTLSNSLRSKKWWYTERHRTRTTGTWRRTVRRSMRPNECEGIFFFLELGYTGTQTPHRVGRFRLRFSPRIPHGPNPPWSESRTASKFFPLTILVGGLRLLEMDKNLSQKSDIRSSDLFKSILIVIAKWSQVHVIFVANFRTVPKKFARTFSKFFLTKNIDLC